MPRKSQSKGKIQFLVGDVHGLSRTMIYASNPKEAAREWCKQRTSHFWETHSMVTLRVDKCDPNSQIIGDIVGEPSFWLVDATQPPAWIIEKTSGKTVGNA